MWLSCEGIRRRTGFVLLAGMNRKKTMGMPKALVRTDSGHSLKFAGVISKGTIRIFGDDQLKWSLL